MKSKKKKTSIVFRIQMSIFFLNKCTNCVISIWDGDVCGLIDSPLLGFFYFVCLLLPDIKSSPILMQTHMLYMLMWWFKATKDWLKAKIRTASIDSGGMGSRFWWSAERWNFISKNLDTYIRTHTHRTIVNIFQCG